MNVSSPGIAYQETILKGVTSIGKFIRRIGNTGQFGHVVIEVAPLQRGTGFKFINATKEDLIPLEYIPGVQEGIEKAMNTGVLAGYPVVDVSVKLIDGSYHAVNSSKMAFAIAGSMAFKDAMKRATPILLEPIMNVEVIVPDEYLDKVIHDLNTRRAQIQKTEKQVKSRIHVILAETPHPEMLGYVETLRSLTQNRANCSMEFVHYNEVPTSIMEGLVSSVNRNC